MSSYFGGYGVVGLMLLLGVGFVVVGLSANRVLRPARPSAGKLATYECGVDPVGTDWAQSQVRYYVYAFLYVIFAIESVFLFPWATIYALPRFGAGALADMAVFVGFLALGLLYAWRKRVLAWT